MVLNCSMAVSNLNFTIHPYYVMHYILFEFHFYTIQTNACMVENVTKRQNGKNKLFGSLIKLKLLTKQLPILL